MRDAHDTAEVFIVAPGAAGDYGGIGRLAAATARYWRAAGMQPPLRVLDPYGARLSPLTARDFARALALIAWNARRRRIALLHVHMAARGSAVRKGIITRMGARLGVPVLLHMHGSRLDEFHAQLPQWGRRMLRRTLESADRIIAPGTHWRDVLVDTVGVDASLVRVIANAAAGPSHVEPRPARPLCELVFLGKLSPRKGLPELLGALAQPDVALLPWRLRVAGDGDAGPYVEQATALGIAARVDFVGWVPEGRVRDMLAAADVFVLPSHNEGLSIGMLEAMAHGCAIVATPVGATLDAVRDGESALLVPAGDVPALAGALRRVIADPALRAALQAAARKRWSDGFDIADHCRQLAALYRELGEPSLPRRSAGVRYR